MVGSAELRKNEHEIKTGCHRYRPLFSDHALIFSSAAFHLSVYPTIRQPGTGYSKTDSALPYHK